MGPPDTTTQRLPPGSAFLRVPSQTYGKQAAEPNCSVSVATSSAAFSRHSTGNQHAELPAAVTDVDVWKRLIESVAARAHCALMEAKYKPSAPAENDALVVVAELTKLIGQSPVKPKELFNIKVDAYGARQLYVTWE
ncbi:hypothetical protein QFC22_005189 [Naganishia vaughanmartiniae]|uniref:Uncharacterized protein n=1 Tax=Naganishia vaughanmartiniae TaxID=1424756 RepID=A0ACC2WUZ5_9TREE|nr:hypothetical protein QFC22_005189 [Naganishia vaughanmartiniae]